MSTKSVIDTCVMPVLVYGCENWILTERTIHQLESFPGWMIKKVLKWPQHLCNTAALVAFGVESIKSRILTRKLRFLLCLISGNADGVAVSAMHALVSNPVSSENAGSLKLYTVSSILTPSSVVLISVCLQQIKKEVLQADKSLLLDF